MNIKSLIILSLCFGLANMGTIHLAAQNIVLTSQTQIDNFAFNYPGDTIGNLTINDSGDGTTDITNLDGLSQITFVEQRLSISNNDALTNLGGLSQLTSVGLWFEIFNNDALTNLYGLSQITSVGQEFIIANNDVLANLDGLSQLTSVGLDIYIHSNPALTHVDGLSQVTSIGGGLIIYSNDALTNLDGLSQLTSIGFSIEFFLSSIEIQYNPQLSQCCVLCPLLAADMIDPNVILGGIIISNNNTGCNSQAEIEACMPCAACVANLTLTTNEMGNDTYTAGNSISSTDNIVNGESVIYDAGELIELQSDFSVEVNADFSATIGNGCQ